MKLENQKLLAIRQKALANNLTSRSHFIDWNAQQKDRMETWQIRNLANETGFSGWGTLLGLVGDKPCRPEQPPQPADTSYETLDAYKEKIAAYKKEAEEYAQKIKKYDEEMHRLLVGTDTSWELLESALCWALREMTWRQRGALVRNTSIYYGGEWRGGSRGTESFTISRQTCFEVGASEVEKAFDRLMLLSESIDLCMDVESLLRGPKGRKDMIRLCFERMSELASSKDDCDLVLRRCGRKGEAAAVALERVVEFSGTVEECWEVAKNSRQHFPRAWASAIKKAASLLP